MCERERVRGGGGLQDVSVSAPQFSKPDKGRNITHFGQERALITVWPQCNMLNNGQKIFSTIHWSLEGGSLGMRRPTKFHVMTRTPAYLSNCTNKLDPMQLTVMIRRFGVPWPRVF